jgi:hypothetical protein
MVWVERGLSLSLSVNYNECMYMDMTSNILCVDAMPLKCMDISILSLVIIWCSKLNTTTIRLRNRLSLRCKKAAKVGCGDNGYS